MGNFSLIGRALLAGGNYKLNENEPFGNSGLAILSDGSFFASVWIENNDGSLGSNNLLRMWHLSSDLAVLGTIDQINSFYFSPYAIPLRNNKVLSILQALNSDAGRSRFHVTIIDCSGDVPVLESTVIHEPEVFWMRWGSSGSPMHILDFPNNRAILMTSGGIQIFSTITGESLGKLAFTCDMPMDFQRDPSDLTHFVAVTPRAVNFDFTINTNNVITLNNTSQVPYTAYDNSDDYQYSYPLSGVSLPLPSTILSANDNGPIIQSFPDGVLPPGFSSPWYGNYASTEWQYFKGASPPLAKLNFGKYFGSIGSGWQPDGKYYQAPGWQADGYVDFTGPSLSLARRRYQIGFYEHGFSNNYYGEKFYTLLSVQPWTIDQSTYIRQYNDGGKPEFQWRMIAIDRDHPEDGFEILELWYFGFQPPTATPGTPSYDYDSHTYSCNPPDANAVSLWAGSPGIAVDQSSGVILSGMTCVNEGGGGENTINFMLWAIQGPKGVAPPMRQRARDDGLSVDQKHERGQGSSQQSSLRRSGKTYY